MGNLQGLQNVVRLRWAGHLLTHPCPALALGPSVFQENTWDYPLG